MRLHTIGIQTGLITGLVVTAGLVLMQSIGPFHNGWLAILGILSGVCTGLMATYFLKKRLAKLGSQNQAQDADAAPTPSARPVDMRATFDKFVEEALAQANRVPGRTAVLMLAIDRLDEVRLGLGEAVAARLEQKTFDNLVSVMRRNESTVRLGPNLFAAIVQNSPGKHEDEMLANRLLDRFSDILEMGPEQLKISISIGLARQSDPISSSTLVRMAQIALYDAQSLGGGQIQIHGPTTEDSARERKRIARDLENAVVTRTGLSMVFQPIFDTREDRAVGAEAFLRWNHPVHGRLAVTLLIEIAEAIGISSELGEYTLEETIAHLSRSSSDWIVVNVSPTYLLSPGFVPTVERLLATYGVAPGRLHIEILPSYPNASADQVLDALLRIGVVLVLDGVDTAQRLEHAQQWDTTNARKASKVKLGGAIAENLGKDMDAEAALWSLMQLAGARGVIVSAKNVETDAQRIALERLGITEMQGRAFAPPVTALTLDTFVERSGERNAG